MTLNLLSFLNVILLVEDTGSDADVVVGRIDTGTPLLSSVVAGSAVTVPEEHAVGADVGGSSVTEDVTGTLVDGVLNSSSEDSYT